MEELKPCKCLNCAKKCPIAEMANGIAWGRYYAERLLAEKEKELEQLKAENAQLRAEPENKALTLFSAITKSPEALAKFLRAVDVGKIKLSESFCKSDCGDDDDCPHELQCIINWLNQPYARKPKGSETP